MTTWERPSRNQQRRKTQSFSSSLLDAIYHSIDESEGQKEEQKPEEISPGLHRRNNNAVEIEEEIASLRRAMMIEKWMENYPTKTSRGSRRVNSYSSSSTDSSLFSSSETEKSTPKSSVNNNEGSSSFTRTKSRAMKIYGDLKKVKQPISPGAKITNFFNSIFNSRNIMKKHNHHQGIEVEDSTTTTTTTCLIASRSCLNRPSPSSCDLSPSPGCARTGVLGTLVMQRYTKNNNKSKRSVRFCPVDVILDEDSQPCGKKTIYDTNNDPILTPMPNINSHFLKKNIDSFKYEEKNPKKHKYRGFYNYEDEDDDDGSCTSSDLFELENIGMVGREANREELPVYGTTNLKINQAIAKKVAFVVQN